MALLLGLAVAVEFVLLAQAALTLIAIALFLALALNPGVTFFQSRGLKRGTAVGAVTGMAALVLALLWARPGPAARRPGHEVIDALPDLVADLTKGNGKLWV